MKNPAETRSVGIGHVVTAVAVAGWAASAVDKTGAAPVNPEETNRVQPVRDLALANCLNLARQNSHRHPASRLAVAAAEAPHRQALSGFWPLVYASGGWQRMDEPPDFIFPVL